MGEKSYEKELILKKTRLLGFILFKGRIKDRPDLLSYLKEELQYKSEGHVQADIDSLKTSGWINQTEKGVGLTEKGAKALRPVFYHKMFALPHIVFGLLLISGPTVIPYLYYVLLAELAGLFSLGYALFSMYYFTWIFLAKKVL